MKRFIIILWVLLLFGCHSAGDWLESEAFKYQGIRTMGHAQYQGASVSEVLYTLSNIEKNNGEKWFSEWYKMANYQKNLSANYSANLAKGNALLRASNYFRVSEFFLDTKDSRRLEAYELSRDSFENAISYIHEKYFIWDIPFENGKLRSYYFPGDSKKPLLLFANGFDGTVEENYFFNGRAAILQGYPVILYEGPGQSMALRKYGLTMIHEWDKPVNKIISWAEQERPELIESKKILYGISIGGHLSGQAASKMHNIDGLIIHGGPINMQKVVLDGFPEIASNLYEKGKKDKLNKLVNRLEKYKLLGFQDTWALSQLKWVYGYDNISDILDHLEPYTLENKKLDIPILILNGENDMYEGINNHNKQLFPQSSVYSFPIESGAGSHCQAGAVEQSSLILFKWLNENYVNNSEHHITND